MICFELPGKVTANECYVVMAARHGNFPLASAVRRRIATVSEVWPKAITVVLVLTVSTLLTGVTASAQVIENYFPVIGGPVGGIPSDNSRSQALSRYDAQGVQAGSFVIRTDVSEGLGYNSNVEAVSGGRGSLFNTSTGNLSATSDWSRNSVFLNLSVINQRYFDLPAQNNTQWTVESGGTIDVGKDQIGFTYSHLNVPETPGDLNAVTTAQAVTSRVDAVQFSYTKKLDSPFSFIPAVSISRFDYDNFASSNTVFSQSYRNRVVFQGGVTTEYELAPKENLLFVVQGTHSSYTGSSQGFARRDSNGAELLGGIDFPAPGANVQFRVVAGYQIRDYVKKAYSNLASPIAEASLTWTPTRLTTLAFSFRRDIEDASDETIAGYTLTTARFDVTHELRRNVVLRGHLELDQGNFQSSQFGQPLVLTSLRESGAAQTIYNVGSSATWLLNRNLRLQASDEIFKRQGGGSNYFANVSLLTVGFRF